MRYTDKLTMEDRSKAMGDLTRRKGWKLITEHLIERKKWIAETILLGKWLKNWVMTVMSITEIDMLRKEILDISWFLKIPSEYIMDNETLPETNIEQTDIEDILTDVLT